MTRKIGLLASAAVSVLLGSSTTARELTVPAIFVNATETTVVIRYETLRPMKADGTRFQCQHMPPQTRAEAVTGWNWDDERWSPAAGVEFDNDICVTELRVAAHSSAWVHINTLCDDYEQWVRRNPAIRPSFESFQVVSSNRFVLLKGWDTAKVFERSWDACIYRFD